MTSFGMEFVAGIFGAATVYGLRAIWSLIRPMRREIRRQKHEQWAASLPPTECLRLIMEHTDCDHSAMLELCDTPERVKQFPLKEWTPGE